MRCQRQRLHMAAHFKRLLMRCAHNTGNGVVWHWQMPSLEPFLQDHFGIFGDRLHLRRDFQPREQAAHQDIDRGVAAIQINRADHGFQSVRQNGRALLTARAALAAAQTQRVRQPQFHGQAVQRVLLDQIGPHTR